MAWLIDNKEWLFSSLGVAVLVWILNYIFKKRQAGSNQTIRSGDNSTNIQVGRDINTNKKTKGNDVEKG